MWKKLNKTQKKIALGAGGALLLAVLFPPLTIERNFTGLTDGTNMYQLTAREFGGWGFIGSLDFSREPDPDSFYGRWRQMVGPSLEELRKGKKKFNTDVFLIEILALFAAGGAALFLTRTKKPAPAGADPAPGA